MPTLAEILAKKKTPAEKPAAPVSTAKGPTITPATDKAAMAKTIKKTLDLAAPKINPPEEPRELGATEPGERIPMEHPDNAREQAWLTACHSFDSDLCIVMEPQQPFAWLAVATNEHPEPILLKRLPLQNCPTNANPY